SNRTAGRGGTLNNLGWAAGSTLWVRWVENNDAGNDHALAIDNVQLGLPVAFFGDFNADGSNDAADYSVYQDTFGSTTDLRADANGNGVVDAADYNIWKSHFGQAPPTPGGGGGAAVATFSMPAIPTREPLIAASTERNSAPSETNVVTARGARYAAL